MSKKKSYKNLPKVVVSGDINIQRLEFSIAPNKSRFDNPGKFYNWQTFPAKYFKTIPGGALLLAKLIQSSTNSKVITPTLRKIEQISSKQIVHSFAMIQKFPSSTKEKRNSIYRIARFEGYDGPLKNTPSVLTIENDDPNADIVVLDDAGNGFRESKDFWPLAIRQNKKPLIILKMAYPLFAGALWKELLLEHADQLAVIVSADDLRRSSINISHKLSWERTAIDFFEQMNSNEKLSALRNCSWFIVRFDTDGAILYSNKSNNKVSKLFYDPKIGEEGFADLIPGMMNGIGSAFVAGIVSKITDHGFEKIDDGIYCGLMSARQFLENGFGNDETKIYYPGNEIFDHLSHPQSIFSVVNLSRKDEKSGLQKDWSILGDLSGKNLKTAAINYVKYGNDASLNHVPIGQFRNLKIIDREEIESYNSIKNLIREYLANPHVHRPLSIAVFGSPGSGKSFGVTEVAETVAHGKLKRLEFNLSQFNSIEGLNTSFHQIRDVNLEGQIPIVFFDEFDSEFNGNLGWLKYFLKPMQDGKFTEGDINHPIGRSFFVFAGGTCNSFEEFIKKVGTNVEKFKVAKGPDFVSRLRGYVNIKGVNPAGKNDNFYILRRAFHLRLQLERKAKHLIDTKQKIALDPFVLNAFLNVPIYKHGVRSISAIIEMSSLSKRKIFDKAALPPQQQLDMHTDAKKFYSLLQK